MDEIVVEAQRRAENLQKVPLAVSAFEADSIEKLQITRTQDIGDAVPNLQTYQVTAGTQAMQVHGRGASVQNPGFNVSESPVMSRSPRSASTSMMCIAADWPRRTLI